MNYLKKFGGPLLVLVAFGLATGGGSIIVRRFGFGTTVTAMLSAVLGIFVLFAVFSTVMNLLRRSQMHNINDMHEQLTHTLNEIANGNFNAFVEVQPNQPHREIGVAMNEMARKLGALEQMRQEFISNVSHEIQSPLTSISGFAKLIRDEELPPEQRKHYADVIVAESRRLSSLSDNLLKLSTLDNNKIPLNRANFRLDRQLQQVALALEPQWAAKKINLEVELKKCTVNGDEDLLSQAWINLLHNAIKFTAEGGAITIALDSGTVIISDTGIGISDDDKTRIFERFYKVDKARDRSLGGNGLGLSLVKRIVELHGGSISVSSEPGVGTSFEIALDGLHPA